MLGHQFNSISARVLPGTRHASYFLRVIADNEVRDCRAYVFPWPIGKCRGMPLFHFMLYDVPTDISTYIEIT